MKLNFWQWIGVVLLVVGLIVYARGKGFFGGAAPVDTTPTSPQTPWSRRTRLSHRPRNRDPVRE